MKIVSGSFHQGNVDKFYESAGLQCGINCIVSTCFSIVKKISSWSGSDMDYILETGDQCFKYLGYSQYLALDELPSVIHINGYVFNLEKVEDIKTVDMNIVNDTRSFWGWPFLHCMTKSQAVICVTCDVMFMIRKESNNYYVFDSHSRSNVNGEPTNDGFSCLIKFKNLNELTNYIKHVYLIKREKESCLMQVQFYNCLINESDVIEFKKSLKRNQDNLRKQKCRQSIINTPEHENIKESMRERYETSKESIREKYGENKDVIHKMYLANKDVIHEKYDKDARHEMYAGNKDVIHKKYLEKYDKDVSHEMYVANKD